jgi:acyl-CoA thioesterase-2
MFLRYRSRCRYALPFRTMRRMPRTPLERLLKQLQLDRLDQDLFLGDPGGGEGRLFGGLVAAQAVTAAYRTVEDRSLHSLHAYFLRPGRHDVPIRFVVYRIRDGRSFTTRDVVAYQAGEAIFNVSTSFVRPEPGIEHQEPPPDVPPPDGLPDWDFVRRDFYEGHPQARRWIRESAVELRSADNNAPPNEGETPRRRVWMNVKGDLPDEEWAHAALMVYASDRGLIATVRRAHSIGRQGMGGAASLDHAMWFHSPPRFDGWLLYTSDSPVARTSRALIFGQVYDEAGVRVASVVQEGLFRSPRE